MSDQEKPVIKINSFSFMCDVDDHALHKFFDFYDSMSVKDGLIINVSSDGGNPEVTLKIQDFVTSRNRPTLVVAIGDCSSAAMGFFGIRGTTRLAYSSCRFMEHQLLLNTPKMSIESICSSIDEVQSRSHLFEQRLTNWCGLREEECKELFSPNDLYFDAIDALMFGTRGIIDGIIIRQLDDFEWIVLTRDGFKRFMFPRDIINENPVLTEEELKEYGLKPYKPDNVIKAIERRKHRQSLA
ncbi:hypothetical protein D6_0207 [Aeromonas phage D6]|uniref:Clp protease n=1 Tax=Aeromonas phage D6 TaxID=2593322 RepID=A0A514TWF6_9CAUD|nr:hypothetical protein PQC08_gp068 [Aeromonas phage D6]QDJ97366.1 hypothetical protein D6_0207 [Aeromonas phage D6]